MTGKYKTLTPGSVRVGHATARRIDAAASYEDAEFFRQTHAPRIRLGDRGEALAPADAPTTIEDMIDYKAIALDYARKLQTRTRERDLALDLLNTLWTRHHQTAHVTDDRGECGADICKVAKAAIAAILMPPDAPPAEVEAVAAMLPGRADDGGPG